MQCYYNVTQFKRTCTSQQETFVQLRTKIGETEENKEIASILVKILKCHAIKIKLVRRIKYSQKNIQFKPKSTYKIRYNSM
jgi:hypothetical protein